MRLAVLLPAAVFLAPLASGGTPIGPRTVSTAAIQAVSGTERQPATTASPEKLPPLSYVCPMSGDEDVIEDAPGKCRRCGMELQPVRLVSVWTCPGQPGLVAADKPGKCPVDGRPLVQMTMAITWSCPGSHAELIRPGTCADGAPMTAKYSLRPHGNHNPQHGGQFFMAPDNWHHLEGAYIAPGTFRLYLYDDFTKPLPLAQVRNTTARLILTGDGKTAGKTEVRLLPRGRFLEARVGKIPLPATMQARVKFQPEAPEHLFDFAFERFSKDAPTAAPSIPTTTANVTPATTGSTAAITPAAPDARLERGGAPSGVPDARSERGGAPSGVPDARSERGAAAIGTTTPESAPAVDPALITMPIPDTVPEMLAQLRSRNEQIRALIDRGQFAAIYVPAFQAKDVALALDAHRGELSVDRQKIVEPAVNRLVRDAYLLDAFGDLGNKQQIVDAYARFTSAVDEIESGFPKP